MNNMLITGHKGFIGKYLTQHRPDATGLDLKDNNDILTCELPPADTVIHLAAETSVINSLKQPLADATTNIIGTIRLASHYKNARFIYASSGGAIQETIESPYGLSKFCGEEYVKMLCKDYIILRFPNIYGKGSKSVVEKFINGPVNIYGDGSSTRDYVYVEDLVGAIMMAVDWPKGMYSLGTGKSTTVLQLAEATGKPIKHTAKVKGELQYSEVPNTAPNWRPETKVINWIKQNV